MKKRSILTAALVAAGVTLATASPASALPLPPEITTDYGCDGQGYIQVSISDGDAEYQYVVNVYDDPSSDPIATDGIVSEGFFGFGPFPDGTYTVEVEWSVTEDVVFTQELTIDCEPDASATVECRDGQGWFLVDIVEPQQPVDFRTAPAIAVDGPYDIWIDGELVGDNVTASNGTPYEYGPYDDGTYNVYVEWVWGEQKLLDDDIPVVCTPPVTEPPATDPPATDAPTTTDNAGSGGQIPETGSGSTTTAILAGGLLTAGLALLAVRRPRRA